MKKKIIQNSIRNYFLGGLKKTNIAIGVSIGILIGASLAWALTKPHTFSAGTTISSAEVNENFDLLYDRHNSGALAKLNSTQNVPMGGATKLHFNSQVYGDTNYDTGNYRYIVATPGVYEIGYNIHDTQNCMQTYIYIDGASTNIMNGGIISLSTGQYIEVFLQCTTQSSDVQTDSIFGVKQVW